jgi:hypothetical protein
VKRSSAMGFRRTKPRVESALRHTSNHCDTRHPVAQVWPKATSPRPFWLVEAVEVEPQSHPVIAVSVHDLDRVRQRLTRSQVAAGVDASLRRKTSNVTPLALVERRYDAIRSVFHLPAGGSVVKDPRRAEQAPVGVTVLATVLCVETDPATRGRQPGWRRRWRSVRPSER